MAISKKYRSEYNSNKHEIKKIARCFNMSDEGVRIYEKRGLVHPDVKDDSKIRTYDNMDFTMLLYSRVYKKCDFTLKEVEEIAKRDSIEDIQKRYEERIQRKQEELKNEERTLECMKDIEKGIRQISQLLGKCEVAEFPGLYRLEFMMRGSYLEQEEPELSRLVSLWTGFSPCTMISTRYDKEMILAGGDVTEAVSAGLGMYQKYAESFGVSENEYVCFCPPTKAVHTIMVADNNKLIPDMAYVSAYVKENGLIITGDAITIGIANTNFDTTFTRYFHLWLPIEEVNM
ncbi:MAG: MerR family transcriptional regulator [Lachnospiraceae bacterium]|nr:MerR family transcriptional regulator [Lachnospiraceae bacterium]